MRDRSFLFKTLIAAILLSGAASLPLAAQKAASKPKAHGPLLYLSQAKCRKAKADMSLEAIGGGPSLIYVGFCEENLIKPAPGQISSGSTQNSLQDSVIRFTEKQMRELPGLGNLPANLKAVVVVLSPDQINCIRDKFDVVVNVKESTRFKRRGTSGDVEDKVAELRLDECGR